MKICLSLVVLDLGLPAKFRTDLPAYSRWMPCLEFAGVSCHFGRAQQCFIRTVWFQRGCCEALRSVAIMGHVGSIGKSDVENGMEAEN
jgi:hypothetical protein